MNEWIKISLGGKLICSISQIFMSCILETALWLGPGFAGKTHQHLLVLTPTLSVHLSKHFGMFFNVNLNLLVLEELSGMCRALVSLSHAGKISFVSSWLNFAVSFYDCLRLILFAQAISRFSVNLDMLQAGEYGLYLVTFTKASITIAIGVCLI